MGLCIFSFIKQGSYLIRKKKNYLVGTHSHRKDIPRAQIVEESARVRWRVVREQDGAEVSPVNAPIGGQINSGDLQRGWKQIQCRCDLC